jgi:hypothetical protein
MHLVADTYLEIADNLRFEWVGFISADSYSEALRLIEQRMA